MESQPQNPEFRKNLENFHPCNCLNAGELGMLFCHLIFLQGIPPACQKVIAKSGLTFMLGLIWVHKVCKDCSKLTLAVKEIKDLCPGHTITDHLAFCKLF